MSKNYQIDIDGYIGDGYCSKRYVKNVLSQNKGKEVLARFNSLGGSLDHGLDIAEQFAEHGNVTVHMTGFNASSSTIASLGAKRVTIADTGFYLVHKVMNWVNAWGYMNADQIAKVMEDLEANKKENQKIDLVLAQKYAQKSGKSISEIMDVLKAGSWLTAKEAFDLGFVDEIISSGEKVNFTAELAEKFNAIGLPLPVDQEEKNKVSALETESIKKMILDTIKGAFVVKKINHIQSEVMKKDNYKKVNEVLAVEHLDVADGKVALAEDQIQNIEIQLSEKDNTISEKDNTISEKDKKIAELEEQIKNLKDAAGDDTTQVRDEDDDNGGDSGIYARSKQFFNDVKDLI